MGNQPKLPQSAKHIARVLTEYCSALGLENQVIVTTSGGGHPKIKVTYDGVTRKLSFPSSPSDHRAVKNGLSSLKRLISTMGLPFDEQKELLNGKVIETEEDTAVGAALKSALNPGAIVTEDEEGRVHHEPIITRKDDKPMGDSGDFFKGIQIPICPKDWVNKKLPFGAPPVELHQPLKDREEFVWDAFTKAGASHQEISDALQSKGWVMNAKAVSSRLVRTRAKRGDSITADPPVDDDYAKRMVKVKPEALAARAEAPSRDVVALTELVVEAIRPHIQTVLATIVPDDLAAVRAKADKFDAQQDLMKDDNK